MGKICPRVEQGNAPFLREAIQEFSGRTGSTSLPIGDNARSQRAWDEELCKVKYSELLSTADQVQRARLLAAAAPHSAAWLNAIPNPNLGLHLDGDTVRTSVGLRLGSRLCEPHRCRCGASVGELDLHGLSCRYSAGRLPRHANLNDVVKRALATAGVPSWLEPVGLDRGDGRRPDGLTVFPFSGGLSLCWDSTCIDTFSQSAVVECALSPGAAAAAAEDRKRARYSGLTDRYRFEPIAVETAGVIGPSSLRFLAEIGRRMTGVTGERRESSWLFQRVSVAVARGNAIPMKASGNF